MAIQRIEVITGAGGRRSYSAEEKVRLVGEARGGRGAVAAVSRRHGVCASLIYRWRRQIERGDLAAEPAGFVPVRLLGNPSTTSPVVPAVETAMPAPVPGERRTAQVEVTLR